MVLTKNFIEESFKLFNQTYFNGELDTPHFVITKTKCKLGYCNWKKKIVDGNIRLHSFVIGISNYYNRSAKGYSNTILHEMIHLYIRQNNLTPLREHHGKTFYTIADRINKDGWKIARTDNVDGIGLTDKNQTYTIACFKADDDTAFLFSVNDKSKEYYKREFEQYPKHFKDVFVFKTNDDKQFGHLTKCRRAVRGKFISMNEYNQHLNNQCIVYKLFKK